ncbi:MAG: hypothetical protein AB2A00_34270 [Myxococcota bacterium]
MARRSRAGATAAPSRARLRDDETATLRREMEQGRKVQEAVLAQLGLVLETLTLVRADQARMMAQLGLAGPDTPDIHRCTDGHAHAHPVPRRGKRRAGEGHG